MDNIVNYLTPVSDLDLATDTDKSVASSPVIYINTFQRYSEESTLQFEQEFLV